MVIHRIDAREKNDPTVKGFCLTIKWAQQVWGTPPSHPSVGIDAATNLSAPSHTLLCALHFGGSPIFMKGKGIHLFWHLCLINGINITTLYFFFSTKRFKLFLKCPRHSPLQWM